MTKVTPVRAIRISDELWKKATQIAEELAKQTGFSVTASDVVRKATTQFVKEYVAGKRGSKA